MTEKVTTEVFCTVQIDGLHNWPECPFDEMKILRDLHRHMFHIKAYKKVTHSDRDVEFIMLKHRISKWFRENYWSNDLNSHLLGRMSCETIAELLHKEFDLSACQVDEDGENGSFTRWEEV
jgi:hypothetical protein